MNNSNYGDLNQIRQIIEELDNDISREIYLAVRTPAQLRGILRTSTPLSSSEAYSGTLASRLSLFNDGMLGSVYDLGTYGSTPLKSSSKPEEQVPAVMNFFFSTNSVNMFLMVERLL